MTTSPAIDSTSAWDQYWRDGRVASCGGEGGSNYQAAIADGWRAFFDTLADGVRILDVCTGNGAIARLAAGIAVSRSLRVAIDAVDAAAINPGVTGPGADMIRYSPRVPAERLPFNDGSFDFLVGQYAIEYTDLERTLAELHRVSRPDARLRFVTHAAGSVVVQEAAIQIADAQKLAATGIFDAAEAYARASSSRMSTVGEDEARDRLGLAIRALQAAEHGTDDLTMYRNVGSVIVHAIQQLPRVGSEPVLAKIAETRAAIAAHEARLSAMRRAALDEPRAQAIANEASRLWSRPFRLEALVRDDGALFGWVLASA